MNTEEALDRLTTIDQLPEVGPDLVEEASDCLDTIEASNPHPDEYRLAREMYTCTVNRAVDWNP